MDDIDEKLRIFNKYKKSYREVKCIICNKAITSDDEFEVVVNRRRTHFFHNKCYKKEV